ncbi:MAG: hypothetical protein PHO08_18335 [Methylococcales bacterium]|nr:hypothetical protein [Methylococcales bacterium]
MAPGKNGNPSILPLTSTPPITGGNVKGNLDGQAPPIPECIDGLAHYFPIDK